MDQKSKQVKKISLTAIQCKYALHSNNLTIMSLDSKMMPTMLENISNSFIGWYYQLPRDEGGSDDSTSYRAVHDSENALEPSHSYPIQSDEASFATDLAFPEVSEIHPGGFEAPTGGGSSYFKDSSLSFITQPITDTGVQGNHHSFSPHGVYTSHGSAVSHSGAGGSSTGGKASSSSGANKDTLTAQTFSAIGDEDKDIGLNVATNAKPGDTIIIGNLPHGASLNHGVLQPDGTYVLHPKDLTGLSITPPSNFNGDFNLTVQVTGLGNQHQNLMLPVHVNPLPDKAQIFGVDKGHVKEDTLTDISHQLLIHDPDKGENHFQVSSSHGKFGSFSIDTQGHWHYHLDNKNPQIQKLAQQQHLLEQFTVKSVDGTEHVIKVAIIGTNDAPKLSQVSQIQAKEGDNKISGQFTATDVDTGDHLSFFTQNPPDGFQLNPDGSYTFNPADKAYNHLAEGQQQILQLPITVTDSKGATDTQVFKIVVTGTNDLPIMNAIPPQKVDEGGATLHGQLTATDPDTGDTLSFATTAQVDGFSLNPDGSYTLDPTDNAYNHLAQGQTQVLNIPVTVTDPNGGSDQQVLQITVTGTNDLPTMTTVLPQKVDEGGAILHGQLTATDPDTGDKLTFAATAPVHGFSLNPDGSYTLDPTDSAYNHLAQGQVEHLQIPLKVTDSHGGVDTQVLQITVIGTNDLPQMLTIPPMTLKEGGTAVNGQLSATDPDTGDQLIFRTTSQVDGFSIDAHGNYNFDPSHASYNHLKVGEKQVVDVPVQVTDPHGGKDSQTLHFTLIGTNDKAQITGVDTGDVTEDRNPWSPVSYMANMIHASGHLNVVDPDAGESGFDFSTFISVASHPEWAPYNSSLGGRLSMTKNGDWEYDIDTTKPEIQKLGVGDTLKDSVIVHSIDGTTHKIEITIHGTNDKPTVSGAVVLPGGKEDTDVTLTSTELLANATDIDAHDTLHIEQLISSHGSITDNHDGTYTFHPDKDYNGPVQFNYNVVDNHGGQVATSASMDLANVADKAVIAGADTGTIKEDTNVHGMDYLQVKGQLTITDPDQGQAVFENPVTHSPSGTHVGYQGAYGELLFLQDSGQWQYSAHNSNQKIQQLKEGDTLTDTITVHSKDGTTHDIVITIKGTDDLPIIDTPDASHGTLGSVVEDKSGSGSGNLYTAAGGLQAHDPDSGETPQWWPTPMGGQMGQYGNFDLSSNGVYTYQLDHYKTDHLSAGETVYDTFKVTTYTRGHGSVSQYIKFAVHGTNDAPTVSSPVVLATSDEDKDVTLSEQDLLAHAHDVDHLDTLHIENLTAQHGTITDNHDGTYTFHPEKDYNGPVQFHYTVHDNHGAKVQTYASMTITPVGDPAVLHSPAHASLTEDTNLRPVLNQLNTGWQDLNITDPDGTPSIAAVEIGGQRYTWDPTHVQTINGNLGTFEFGGLYPQGVGHGNPVNQWLYRADNSSQGIQQLGEHETISETLTLITNDGTRIPITVTVNGKNDTVVIDSPNPLQGQIGSVTEQGSRISSAQGNLQAHDIDQHDTVHFEATIGQGQPGNYGSFKVDSSGHWTYTVDPAKAQQLANGEWRLEAYNIKAISSDGSEATQKVTVAVWGSNQGPVVSATIPDQSINENQTFHYHIPAGTFTDVDNQDQLTLSATLADGSALPSWLHFNPATQTFSGTQPHNVVGDLQVKVTAMDKGHSAASDTFQVSVLDITPPAVPGVGLQHDTGSSASDLVSQDGHLQLTGVEAGAVVAYSIDNGQHWSSSFTPQQGQNHVMVRQTDASGNISQPGSLSFTLDNQVSAPQVSLRHDTGAHANDNITKDSHLNIQGLEQGAEVEYSLDGGKHWTNTYSPQEGVNNLLVRQTDTAGNVSPTTHLTFTLDTQAPHIQIDSVTTDNVINFHEVQSGIDITGTTTGIAAGSSIDIQVGPYALPVTIQPDGSFGLHVNANTLSALVNTANFDVTATYTDLAGNTAAISGQQVVMDLNFPGGVNVSLLHDTGSSASDLITNDGQLHFGNIEPGCRVEYSIDGGHTWHSSFTPQQGQNSVSVRQINPHGNVSPVDSLTFTLDNQVSAPQVSLRHDTGAHANDNITKDSHLNIQGLEQGAEVEYSLDGGKHWTNTYSPQEGVNHLLVRQTDTAGNVSPTTALNFTLDTQSGTIHLDSIGGNNHILAKHLTSGFNITGSTSGIKAGETISIMLGNTGHVQATVASDGSFKAHVSPQQAQVLSQQHLNAFVAHHQDAAGNAVDSNVLSTSTDINPPATLQVGLQHDTGSSASDLVSQDGHLQLTGVEAGAVVEYSIDNGQHWSSSFTPQQGQNHVMVRQTDASGNTSQPGSLSFTLDNQVSAPQVSLQHDTGAHANDNITKDSHLNIQGFEQGAEVEYSLDGGKHWTNTYSPQEGVNHLLVRQTDTAGNVSPSTQLSFTLDTQAGSIHLEPISQDNTIDASEQQSGFDITGHVQGIEVGEQIGIILGTHHLSATVQSDGSFSSHVSPQIASQLSSSAVGYTYFAIHTDMAGNTVNSNSELLSVSSAPLPTPTVQGVKGVGSSSSMSFQLHSQGTPGQWAIDSGAGHSVTTLHGQYGSLTIDPQTGQATYHLDHGGQSGVIKHGGSLPTSPGMHEDVFHIMQHGQDVVDADMEVKVKVQSIHGHSGHHTEEVTLAGVDMQPLAQPAPPPPVPDANDTYDEASGIQADIANLLPWEQADFHMQPGSTMILPSMEDKLSSADIEDIEVTLVGLPKGTVLSSGSLDNEGHWHLSVDDLSNLAISIPKDVSGALSITTEIDYQGQHDSMTSSLTIDSIESHQVNDNDISGSNDVGVSLDLSIQDHLLEHNLGADVNLLSDQAGPDHTLDLSDHDDKTNHPVDLSEPAPGHFDQDGASANDDLGNIPDDSQHNG